MKVLIISDTHGSNEGLMTAVSDHPDIDMLIHLGDGEDLKEEIHTIVNCPVHMVRGNNDYFCDLPMEEEFDLADRHVFITHGHSYGVSLDERTLREEARARGADIVMYGHTHRPVCHQDKGLWVINPGSTTYPRQSDRRGTYMIMEISENTPIQCELKYV